MCGICGFSSSNNIGEESLRCLNDLMYHRGPNDNGTIVFHGYNYIGMAHRRLSIVDLSRLGHQPMVSEDEQIVLVFNGEIYNYRELRKQLADYPFRSNCDTEVIIAAYLHWGINCVKKFNGMFSIALYDKRSDELFLVRDRVGKKPLYYWYEEGNIFFSSELKPIINHPQFNRRIKEGVLKKYLCNGYIKCPDTIFENVYQIEQGTILRYFHGEVSTQAYWSPIESFEDGKKSPISNYEEAKSCLKALLVDSIQKRLVADVPVGCFLSGGIDSSLVCAIAQSVSKTPIKTFTIGFEDQGFNEALYAKEVANILGTEHTEVYLSEKEMFDLIETIPQYFDEPFADPSEIPTMLVSSLAKEQVTVALTGDGGDELFCGYERYKRVYEAQKIDLMGQIAHTFFEIPIIKRKGLITKVPHGIRAIANNRERNEKCQFHIDSESWTVEKMLPGVVEKCKYDEEKYLQNNWQEECMLLDMETYLPSLLCKTDRASMKYSLECRCPVLDYRIVDLAYRIPHQYKFDYMNGGKKILKDIAYEYVPKKYLDRPKMGFGVPIGKWLRNPLRERLAFYGSEEFLIKQGLFNPQFTSEYITDFINVKGDVSERLAWHFYVFQQWYVQYIL